MSERESTWVRFLPTMISAFGGLLIVTSALRTALAFWLTSQLGMTAAEFVSVVVAGPSRETDYSGTLVRAIILLYKAGYQLVIGALLIGVGLRIRRDGRLFTFPRRTQS